MENLKACPFCGKKANLITQIHGFTVYCSECGASIKHFIENKEQAINSWNNRQESYEIEMEIYY